MKKVEKGRDNMNERMRQSRRRWLLSLPILISLGVVGFVGVNKTESDKKGEENVLTLIESDLGLKKPLQIESSFSESKTDPEDNHWKVEVEVDESVDKDVSSPPMNTDHKPPVEDDSVDEGLPQPPVMEEENENEGENENEDENETDDEIEDGEEDPEEIIQEIVPPQIEIEEIGKQLKVTITHELLTGSEEEELQYRINYQEWETYEAPFYLPIDDYVIESQLIIEEKVSKLAKEDVLPKLPTLEAPRIEVTAEKYRAEVSLSHPRFEGLPEEVIEYRIEDQEWQPYEKPFDWLPEWQSLEVRYREGSRVSEMKREMIVFEHPICERGNATKENPCVITTPKQLNALQIYVNVDRLETAGQYYELGNDIDLTGFDSDNDPSNGNWHPIGLEASPFKGVLDGNFFTIYNFNIDLPQIDYVGFFGVTDNSEIRNVIIKDYYVRGRESVGGLIGKSLKSYMEMILGENGFVEGNVTRIGGLIGYTANQTKLENLSFNGEVYGTDGTTRIGGLIGHHTENSVLTYGRVKATVSGGSHVGGLVGFNNGSSIVNGLTEIRVFAKENIVGGVVGQSWGNGFVSNVFATGEVLAQKNQAGGVVGWNYQSIVEKSLSNTIVSGADIVGGVVGGNYNGANIRETFSIATINSKGSQVGGVSGSNGWGSNIYSDNYWNKELYNGTDAVGGIGLSTSQTTGFNALKYMEGFDFENTWQLCQGDYPQLKAFTTCKPLQTGYAGGSGTKDDPYLISSEQQLDWLRFEVNELGTDTLDVYYELIKSLDFSKYDSDGVLENGNWVPIKTFKGYFNGKGHSIENLKVIMPNSNDVGVFGDLENATIKNIYLTNLRLEGNDRVGGVAGYTANSEIIQVSVQGIVNGKYRVGGVIGSFYNSRLKEVFSDVLVTNGGARTGGIVGSSWSGWISNSFSQSTVLGKQHTGGIVGYNASYSKVENSVNIGQVLGDGQKGGLAGYNVGSTVINSYWNVESALITTTIGEGIGLTTSQMTDFNAFKYIKDFDFENTWQLCQGGYPKLKWKNDECFEIPTGYESGVGTEIDPFLIKTADQLNWLRIQANTDAVKYTKGKYFRLVDNINLKDFDTDNNPENGNWVPIGTNEQRFQGTFLGNGHKISNLKVIQPDMDYVGLFGRIGSATIQKVALEDVMIEGKNYAGGLIGYTFYNCYVKDVFVSGLVKGVNHVGSLTGVNYSTLQNIAIATTVESVGIRGPLVGTNYGQVVSAYYDKEVSLESGSLGSPLTTSQMTGLNAIKHMEGFDFENTWQACEGDYPQLKVFATCQPASQPAENQEELTSVKEEKPRMEEEVEEETLIEEEERDEVDELTYPEGETTLEIDSVLVQTPLESEIIEEEEEIIVESERIDSTEEILPPIEENEDCFSEEVQEGDELSETINLKEEEEEVNLIEFEKTTEETVVFLMREDRVRGRVST